MPIEREQWNCLNLNSESTRICVPFWRSTMCRLLWTIGQSKLKSLEGIARCQSQTLVQHLFGRFSRLLHIVAEDERDPHPVRLPIGTDVENGRRNTVAISLPEPEGRCRCSKYNILWHCWHFDTIASKAKFLAWQRKARTLKTWHGLMDYPA